MKYRRLGNTGFEVSTVVYGGIVSMAHGDGRVYQSDGQATSDGHVAWAIDHGINYFDVAPTYGDAQQMMGNSLRPYRKGVYLACKTEARDRA